MKENETQFTMRMSNDVYDGLKKRAERHKRSIAKELEFITEQALEADDAQLTEQLKKFFAVYDKEQGEKVNLQHLLADNSIQSPLKDAANELINFVKNL